MTNLIIKIVFLLVSMAVCLSCGPQTAKKKLENGPVIIHLDDGFQIEKSWKLSEIAKNIHYVKLENSEASQIGRVHRLKMSGDYLMVQDGNSDKLLIFDKNGKFIQKIGREGKGPGEYAARTDFDLDATQNLVAIYDDKQQKLLRFNFQGELLSEQRVAGFPLSIKILPQERILLYMPRPLFRESDMYAIHILDKNNQLVERAFHRTEYTKEELRSEPIAWYSVIPVKDDLVFWEAASQTVFSFNDGDVQATYKLDYDDALPEEIITGGAEKLNPAIRSKAYVYVNYLQDVGSYFFMSGNHKGQILSMIYDKQTGEASTLMPIQNLTGPLRRYSMGITNDIDGGLPFPPGRIAAAGITWVSFYAPEVRELLEEDVFKDVIVKDENKRQSLIAFLDSFEEDDNPAVMLVEMK